MDPSFNYFDQEIRVADEIKREQLLEDNKSIFDKEIEKAIYLSMQNARDEEIKNFKFEEEVINKYYIETELRREIFANLLLNMKKLFKFDKDIKEIYDIIEPIIDSYCNQYITKYE